MCWYCCSREDRRPARLVDSLDVTPAQPYDGPLVTPTGARPPVDPIPGALGEEPISRTAKRWLARLRSTLRRT